MTSTRADFVQTQYCFKVERSREYLQRVRDLGLHERVFILVGAGVPPNDGFRAGICAPDAI
jgi:5,10-methylenetetrahydrofolate reductase